MKFDVAEPIDTVTGPAFVDYVGRPGGIEMHTEKVYAKTDFGTELRAWRREHHQSLRDAGNRIGISFVEVSQLEQGLLIASDEQQRDIWTALLAADQPRTAGGEG